MRSTYFKAVLILSTVASVDAQSFNSGSTGADGVLALTTPGTVMFDPHAFKPQLSPSGDGVYQFTSVYIAKDVKLELSSNKVSGPIFWLVQGSVDIEGTIDLNGAEGGSIPSIAGAGGFPGGAPQEPGYGPDTFRPNVFLVPLVGGAGGQGGEIQGGGAGGGALLIASSSSIVINGVITANGGRSNDGVGGNGGAIRLVAPVIEGSSGLLSAKGGQPGGSDGFIRFEALDNQFAGTFSDTPYAQGKPFALFLPPNPQPTVKVVSIGGRAVTAREFTIEQPSPVLVLLEAKFIPPGTIIQLELFPEKGGSRQVSSSPLEGTFELSHATASVTLAGGLSRGLVKASWKLPADGDQRR